MPPGYGQQRIIIIVKQKYKITDHYEVGHAQMIRTYDPLVSCSQTTFSFILGRKKENSGLATQD